MKVIIVGIISLICIVIGVGGLLFDIYALAAACCFTDILRGISIGLCCLAIGYFGLSSWRT